VSAADGVDARARRVAARLLSVRSRRSGAPVPRHLDVLDDGSGSPAPRHPAGGHPAGAARIARTLRALEADGWVSLAQVQRPGRRGEPRLDHLVIGPGGVVVLSGRPWAGRIEVSRGVVQQDGFWREHETAALARAAGSIAALLLPQHRTAVHAFICIAQHDLTEHVVAPGVHVVGVSGLARALQALPYRLHPAEVLHLNTVLRHWLVEAEAPEQLTTAELDAFVPEARPGAHREPGADRLTAGITAGAAGFHVPPVGAGPRSAARSAARRQRPRSPWWHHPRVLVPRVLLVSLLLVGALVAGPGVVRALGSALGVVPAATSSPAPPEAVLPEPGGADAAWPDQPVDPPDATVLPAPTGREDPPEPPASSHAP